MAESESEPFECVVGGGMTAGRLFDTLCQKDQSPYRICVRSLSAEQSETLSMAKRSYVDASYHTPA